DGSEALVRVSVRCVELGFWTNIVNVSINEAEPRTTDNITFWTTAISTGTPLHLAAVRRGEGECELQLFSAIGSECAIDISDDLLHWHPWANLVSQSAITYLTDSEQSPNLRRFYRARRVCH